MNFLEFIVVYWRYIVVAIAYLVSLVFSIILLVKKNKGFDVYSKAINKVLVNIPEYICVAEASGATGARKKLMVINLALQDLCNSFGRELTDDESNYIQGLLNQYIELVLCTPQKKEDKNGKI